MPSQLSKPMVTHPSPSAHAVPKDAFAAAAGTAVDCHFHIFAAHQAVPGARYVPAYSAGLADWSAKARAVGVQRGLLVQPSFLGTDNSLMLQALAQPGQALRGVAVVAPDVSLTELHRMHALGVRGIRLNLAGISHDLHAWHGATALWAELEALGWHLELHTDQGALPAVLAQLHGVLPPGLHLVLDHFARPASASAQDASVQAVRRVVNAGTQVWVKLSASYRLGGVNARALAQLWVAELGPHRLLWGSDWPCTNHEALADYAALHCSLAQWVDDVSTVDAISSTNPQQLLA